MKDKNKGYPVDRGGMCVVEAPRTPCAVCLKKCENKNVQNSLQMRGEGGSEKEGLSGGNHEAEKKAVRYQRGRIQLLSSQDKTMKHLGKVMRNADRELPVPPRLCISLVYLARSASLLLLLSSPLLVHLAEQLGLQNELVLLVLLRRLIGLVVLPADNFAATTTGDVAHHVAARRHIAFGRCARFDVDNRVEQVRFSMLTPEVSANNIIVVGKVRLADLAAVDTRAAKVCVVRETHGCRLWGV